MRPLNQIPSKAFSKQAFENKRNSIIKVWVLRKIELLLIQKKDVPICEDHAGMQFPCSTKRRAKGLMFKGSDDTKESLELCVNQLD